MANSGQPDRFFGENVGEADLPSDMNPGTDCDPNNYLSISELFRSPQNQTMEMLIDNQQYRQLAATIHGLGCPDQTNINVQTTGTFDSQHHGQSAGTSHQISFSGQPSSDQTDINVQTTHIPKMTEEQRQARRKEINRKSRAKKKNEVIAMKDKLKKLEDEKEKLRIKNAELQHANVSMGENLQSLTDVKDKLESNLEKLKQQRDKPDAILQELLKDKDFKFIKEGDKHDMRPTQDQSPSDEEMPSEKEISAGNLDGGDSEDDNDYKKKKKRAARSAPSEGRAGKVPKFACYDARADQRHRSTSNHTAMVRDPYSIAECLRILKTMADIPYPIVKKATAKFKSPDDRETFVELREDWRMDWVKDLENDA